MLCQECFGKAKTVDTRHYQAGEQEGRFPWVERRVVCLYCEHKMHTVEVSRELWREAFAALSRARRAESAQEDQLGRSSDGND